MSTKRPSMVSRGASNGQPAPPLGGLPPQRTPRRIAYLIKLFVYPFMFLDLVMQRLVHWINPPPYQLKGHCKRRGNCCHYIFMEWPPLMDEWVWFGRFWLWWYTDIHGFFVRGFDFENDDGRVAKVLGCRHLQANGSCGNYLLRPAICRQWPRMEFSSGPHILKGCGYSFAPREEDETTQDKEP